MAAVVAQARDDGLVKERLRLMVDAPKGAVAHAHAAALKRVEVSQHLDPITASPRASASRRRWPATRARYWLCSTTAT